MFSKTLFINLILISLILLGTWYTWLQLTRPINPGITGNQPDAYATKVIINHIDESGNLYDQLKTPLSVHYPLDDSISLATPIFTLFLKNKESWQLSSHYGKLKGGKDLLQLWDNVKLEQKQGSANKTISTLTTSSLNIHLKEKIAETSSPVVIRQINQEIDAVGLHANFNTKTIQLLSQVKGQLKPVKK
ncbi:MAG: LPS export ABC transporter periplasmic protein LptC [Gammaproteobacteria bacterium]|nr:MAG: LPS export ABC transporter periplasmic protein LptC [Gammaproteobacteria bacterium]